MPNTQTLYPSEKKNCIVFRVLQQFFVSTYRNNVTPFENRIDFFIVLIGKKNPSHTNIKDEKKNIWLYVMFVSQMQF